MKHIILILVCLVSATIHEDDSYQDHSNCINCISCMANTQLCLCGNQNEIQQCYTIKTCSQQYRNVQKRIQKIIRQTQDNTNRTLICWTETQYSTFTSNCHSKCLGVYSRHQLRC